MRITTASTTEWSANFGDSAEWTNGILQSWGLSPSMRPFRQQAILRNLPTCRLCGQKLGFTPAPSWKGKAFPDSFSESTILKETLLLLSAIRSSSHDFHQLTTHIYQTQCSCLTVSASSTDSPTRRFMKLFMLCKGLCCVKKFMLSTIRRPQFARTRFL